MNINEEEEIIRLIHKGIDVKLLSFELDIPMEQVENYQKRLTLRELAKESIKNGKKQEAIQQLENYINSTKNNLVERFLVLKLNAYFNRSTIEEEELQQIEEDRKKVELSKTMEEILQDLAIFIPKRKKIKKENKEEQEIKQMPEISEEEKEQEKEVQKQEYQELIEKYKNEIEKNPLDSLKRNLLAFTYLKSGNIDKARKELENLIEQTSNFTAYRQLIYLEKEQGNLEDAKLWAYDCIEKFPKEIKAREQLIAIARKENNVAEIIEQLKEMIQIDGEKEEYKKRLKTMQNQK